MTFTKALLPSPPAWQGAWTISGFSRDISWTTSLSRCLWIDLIWLHSHFLKEHPVGLTSTKGSLREHPPCHLLGEMGQRTEYWAFWCVWSPQVNWEGSEILPPEGRVFWGGELKGWKGLDVGERWRGEASASCCWVGSPPPDQTPRVPSRPVLVSRPFFNRTGTQAFCLDGG